MKCAVVGAGWAGLAAAVTLQRAGHDVTVLESGHTPGGRARRVMHENFDLPIDNGQHILLGAYTHTLALMRSLGRDPDSLFIRLPLSLATLDGAFRLRAPRLPAPLHAAIALLGAHGLDWQDRLGAVRLMRALRGANWQTAPGEPVAALLQRHAQGPDAIRLLWEPLCVAALNTPVKVACAQLFANVLRDSLAGPRAASDLLLPRADLSSLWPDVAAAASDIRYGTTVRSLQADQEGVRLDGERFEAAVLAVPPSAAARLLDLAQHQALSQALLAFQPAPIATLYLSLESPWRLPQPMMMLHEDAAANQPGQWIFDRTQLAGGPAGGEISVVVSAAQDLAAHDRAATTQALIEQVCSQAARCAALPPMPAVREAALLMDKRATFLATPSLSRPGNATPWPRLFLAGDWTDTGYPGVLEGAVRSGKRAAALIAAHA